MTKHLVKAALHSVGLEVRRRRSVHEPSPPPPPVIDDVIEALYRCRAGWLTAFTCSLAQCRSLYGLSYAEDGWHAHCAAALQLRRRPPITYEASILKRFYDTWQPANAAEVVIGFNDAPRALAEFPAYAFVPPWNPATPSEWIAKAEAWARRDCIREGKPALDLATHGNNQFGPVSRERGSFELGRFTTLMERIIRDGYDRTGGDMRLRVVRHGEDLLFVGASGHHRRAVLHALGHTTITAVPQHAMIIDTADVGQWPQVRRGLWSEQQALRYVDHLFEFDTLAWAREKGLAT
jgi:hypothetical protein